MTARGVERRIRAFLDDIAEEVVAVRLLVDAGNRLAPYHLQQGVEKLLRAVLTHRAVEAGREHDLAKLQQALPADDVWRGRTAGLTHYTRYATSYRYPTTSGSLQKPPDAAEMKRDLATLEALVEQAKKELLP